MQQTDSIGRRIAEYRKLRGWTQRELADRAGYSLSQVEKIERGARAVERYSTLHNFAKTLGIDVAELAGEPGKIRKSNEHATVPEIRRVLTSIPYGIEDGPTSELVVLRSRVQQAIADRQAGKYAKFGHELPPLTEELQRAVTSSLENSPENVEYNWLLAELLHGGSTLLRRLGYVDLSWIAVQHARQAAQQTHDPLALLANDWHITELYLRTGNSVAAAKLVDSALGRLDEYLAAGEETPRVISLVGTFHLVRAMIAAQVSARAEVTEALETADRAAQLNGKDRSDFQTMFGPSNVAMFQVSTSVELGDGAEAVERSRSISTNRILSRERQARYLIDVARGYAQSRKDVAALQVLQDARHTAPEYVLNHVMARELVAQLLEHERRSITPGLRTLAKKMGIT